MEINKSTVKPTKTHKRGFRWRLWIKRLAIGAVVFLLLARLCLPLILPRIIDRVAAGQGLEVRYDKLDLSVLTGRLELWHVSVAPEPSDSKEGDSAEGTSVGSSEDDSFGDLEFLFVDLDVSALLTGKIKAHRVEIDGVDVNARRNSLDSGWQWESLPLFQKGVAGGPVPEQTEAANGRGGSDGSSKGAPSGDPGELKPFDWNLGFEVAAVRLQHVQLHLQDMAAEPPFETSFECNVRLTDLGHAKRPARLEVFAHSKECLDALALHADLRIDGAQLDLEGDFDIRGLRAGPLAPYLETLGIRPRARQVDIGMRIDVHTIATTEDNTSISIHAEMQDVQWMADGEEMAALDHVQIVIPQFSGKEVRTDTLKISGVRAQALRGEDGVLSFGGFDFVGTGPTTAPKETSPKEETSTGPRIPDLHIPLASLEGVAVTFHDRAVQPPVQLQLQLSTATVGPLVRVPGKQSPPIELDVQGSAPGVAGSIVCKGLIQAFGPSQTVDMEIAAEGMTLASLGPYLKGMGIESNWQDATLAARMQAQTHLDGNGVRHAEASLSEVRFADGGALFGVTSLSLMGLRVDEANGVTSIQELALRGTEAHLHRNAEGVWHALGLALVPASTSGSTSTSASKARVESEANVPTPAEAGRIPAQWIVDHLVWQDTSIHIQDDYLQPPVVQVLDGVELDVKSLNLGGAQGGDPGPPAQISLSLSADGLAERLAFEGTAQSLPGPLDVELNAQLIGEQVLLDAVEPWLLELGIQSFWKGAAIEGTLNAHVQQQETEIRLALELSDWRMTDQGVTWLHLTSLRAPQILIGENEVRIDPVRMEGPTALVRRNEKGQLEVLGLRLLDRGSSEKNEPGVVEGAGGVAVVSGQGQESQERSVEPGQQDVEKAPSKTLIHLPSLDWTGLGVRWQDASIQPMVEAEAQLVLALRNWTFGQPMSSPGQFDLALQVPGSLEQLKWTGQVQLDPADLRLQGVLNGSGMQAGILASYLPPQIEVILQNGAVHWEWQAALSEHAEGGYDITVEGQDLRISDGGQEEALFELDRLAFVVPRLDWDGGRVDVQEIAMQGMRLDVKREVDGALRGLGVRFDPSQVVPEMADATGDRTGQDLEAPAVTASGSEGSILPLHTAGGSRRLPRVDPEAPPLVTLVSLDVGVERFRFHDEGGGIPMDTALRLHTNGAQTLLSPNAEELPPLQFQVSGMAMPLVESVLSNIELAPYAAEPYVDVDLRLTGIQGEQITRILPELQEKLSGEAWTSGEVGIHMNAQLDLRRRGPLHFPLQDGFGVQLLVDQFVLRANDQDPQAIGFEELTVHVASIRPKTGDVHVKLVDWTGPYAEVFSDAEGIHLAGWVLKAPQESEPAESAEALPVDELTPELVQDGAVVDGGPSAPEGASQETDINVVATSEGVAEASGPEIRIDEVLITGDRLVFEDRSVEPVFQFPVEEWDFELKRFTTYTLEENRPFRFRLALYSAQVELPKRTTSGNLVSGLLGKVSALAAGPEREQESRPVFDEFLVRGNLSLGPQPRGWTQARIRGFELGILKGMAAESGVEIGDGLLDESTMLHFNGEGGMRVSADTNFSYLSLSEPAGGAISRYLLLPAPLDAVLYALKDKDGDQSIPLNLEIPAAGVSTKKVLQVVGGAVGKIAGEALASAPTRFLSGAMDLVGMGAEPIDLTGDEWIRLDYAPGEMQIPTDLDGELLPLLDLLRRDPSLYLEVQQALGSEDVAQAAVLANPSPGECLQLANSYRRQRKELLQERDDWASQVRLAYAMGQPEVAKEHAVHLRQADATLARTESALDRVLERTLDRGERPKLRRTKGAALEVARRRQTLVGNLIRRQRVASIGARLDLRRPRFVVPEDATRGFVQIAVKRRR